MKKEGCSKHLLQEVFNLVIAGILDPNLWRDVINVCIWPFSSRFFSSSFTVIVLSTQVSRDLKWSGVETYLPVVKCTKKCDNVCVQQCPLDMFVGSNAPKLQYCPMHQECPQWSNAPPGDLKSSRLTSQSWVAAPGTLASTASLSVEVWPNSRITWEWGNISSTVWVNKSEKKNYVKIDNLCIVDHWRCLPPSAESCFLLNSFDHSFLLLNILNMFENSLNTYSCFWAFQKMFNKITHFTPVR